MKQSRLNHLMILSAHKNQLGQLDLTKIASDFINKNNRKHIFGKFNYPVDTGRQLNIRKTFRRRPGRLLNILCTFNLRPVSAG